MAVAGIRATARPVAVISLLLIRTVLCAVATGACYFLLTAIFGNLGQSSEKSVIWAVTIVCSSPIWALALARPIVEFFPAAYQALRSLVWDKESGRWYAYDGQRIRVFTVDGAPWVAVQDIAAVTGWENLDERCRRLPPEQCQVFESTELLCLSEPGIHGLFVKRTDPEALKFGLWIERNVLLQFRLARGRGLRPPRT
jgi:hypothetical protein